MKNKILGGALVVVVLIVVGLVVRVSTNTDSIKIGALLPLTGGLASYGEPAQKTIDMAVADINANGGINGKKLVIAYEDHKCDPKEMLSGFSRLTVQGIHVLNSVACSGVVAGIAPELTKNDSVLFGSVVSASKLTGISPNFFRNWSTDRSEAKVLADQIVKNGYRNVAVIFETTDYAQGLKMDLEKNLADSNVKVVSESFVTGSTDIRTQLTKLKSVKPDALVAIAQTVTTGEMILTQMEQLNFKPAMLVNYNILKSAVLLKKHASLLEGAVAGDFYIPDSAKLNAVLAEYKAMYGIDCPQKNICAMEYDSIQFLAQALRAEGDSAIGVKEYLSQNTYSGASGDISFDSNNDRNNSEYVPFVIKGGSEVKM